VGWTTGRASKGGLKPEPPAGSRAPGQRVKLRICINSRNTLWKSGLESTTSTDLTLCISTAAATDYIKLAMCLEVRNEYQLNCRDGWHLQHGKTRLTFGNFITANNEQHFVGSIRSAVVSSITNSGMFSSPAIQQMAPLNSLAEACTLLSAQVH